VLNFAVCLRAFTPRKLGNHDPYLSENATASTIASSLHTEVSFASGNTQSLAHQQFDATQLTTRWMMDRDSVPPLDQNIFLEDAFVIIKREERPGKQDSE